MLEEKLRQICTKAIKDERFHEELITNPSETLENVQESIGLDKKDLDDLNAMFNDDKIYSSKWVAMLLFAIVTRRIYPPPPPPPPFEELMPKPPPPPPFIELMKIISNNFNSK